MTLIILKKIFNERLQEIKDLEVTYFETQLNMDTAILASGHKWVCGFVNDNFSEPVIQKLSSLGVLGIVLRCAGYNNVNRDAARKLNMRVLRVPSYSPHAVAEHAVGLLLALNRKIPRASQRVHELNFSLEGLVGFDLFKKTVGVVGTGKIGQAFINIMLGFGCQVLAFDKFENEEVKRLKGVQYVCLEDLIKQSDVISLHVPLTPETHHMINATTISQFKSTGAFIINTGRGALIHTADLIVGLKSGRVAGAGLDVYEEEEGVFFRDLSDRILEDDQLARLLTFPNVLITSHQAFLTKEALQEIANTTIMNVLSLFGKYQINQDNVLV